MNTTQLLDIKIKKPDDTVVITVRGGVAECFYKSEDIKVVIVDYDNLEQK